MIRFPHQYLADLQIDKDCYASGDGLGVEEECICKLSKAFL